jgi:hypothetical protein
MSQTTTERRPTYYPHRVWAEFKGVKYQGQSWEELKAQVGSTASCRDITEAVRKVAPEKNADFVGFVTTLMLGGLNLEIDEGEFGTSMTRSSGMGIDFDTMTADPAEVAKLFKDISRDGKTSWETFVQAVNEGTATPEGPFQELQAAMMKLPVLKDVIEAQFRLIMDIADFDRDGFVDEGELMRAYFDRTA